MIEKMCKNCGNKYSTKQITRKDKVNNFLNLISRISTIQLTIRYDKLLFKI